MESARSRPDGAAVTPPDAAAPAPAPATGYAPSPRPSYDVPTLITASTVTRHIWGDDQASEVADWIYVSSDRIHALVFGLPPGGSFRHSPEYRTVFGADEVLTVLRGRMILANPETGEVQLVETGASIAFGQDTWHHAFAHGEEDLRVLELFAPPPSSGTSGLYSRTRPYLQSNRYADDSVLGSWPRNATDAGTLRPIRAADVHYRLVGDALVGILLSTDQLTVGNVSLSPGGVSARQRRGGDEVLFGRTGTLHVRAWYQEHTYVFEVNRDEACFLPRGSVHEYRNYGATTATAVVGVAPSLLDEGGT
jgi:quercetin dioxygenase-like cupin family protein